MGGGKLTFLFSTFIFSFVLGYALTQTGIRPKINAVSTHKYGSVGGQRWENFEGFECSVLGPVDKFGHMGDDSDAHVSHFGEACEKKKRDTFNLQVR